jgi:hypothetical protein
MSIKKQILDPLSCLCKLGMLTYYKRGTKISIINNIISFHKPDNVQWVKRTYNGDCKDDIYMLYNPILKAIEWYIINDKSEEVINIIKYTIEGLNKLENTYKDGNIVLVIKFLKNNLKLCFGDDLTIENFYKFNELEEIEETVINYNIIKKLWTEDKIKLISNQFIVLDKNKDDESGMEFFLKSMKTLLMDIDSKFQELVKNMNSEL